MPFKEMYVNINHEELALFEPTIIAVWQAIDDLQILYAKR